MPSLNDLGQFKFSFNNLAGEKDDIVSKHGDFDDLPLPTKEAPPIDFSAPPPSAAGSEAAPAPAAAPAPEDIASGGFDFGAFLNDLPDVQPSPDDDLLQGTAEDAAADETAIPDMPADSAQPAPEETASEEFNFDDLGLTDTPAEETPQDASGTDDFDINSLLGDSPAGTETPAAEEPPAAAAAAEEDDIDGAIDLGGESPLVEEAPAEASEPEAAAPSDADFDLPVPDDGEAAPSDADFDMPLPDEEDGIDLGGESPEVVKTEEEPAAGADGGDFSLDGLLPPDTGASPDTTPDEMDTDFGSDFGADFDSALPSEDQAAEDGDAAAAFDSALADMDFSGGGEEEAPAGDLPADFDPLADTGGEIDLGAEEGGGTGDFGADFESGSIDLGGGAEDVPLDSSGDGDGDFALPGLDEIFDKGKFDTAPAPAAEKKGFLGRKNQKAAAADADDDKASDDIEEIRLSQEDLDKLLKTLGSYPLNLRIVCQELIAEQVILPQQLSKLIHLLVNGAHVRETADFAQEITGKEIIIPKSFEKMTGAAFEAEQSSFAYIFIHNFLPVFRIFAIIALFLGCAGFLAYRYIYIPVKAENLYKRGYERIFAGEYQRANELFHEAFITHRKKKWFYAYAEGFRDQRRYMLAEAKYDELLRYYPRDKKGVLDYAALNTYYLLNYDKANRLLQHELLDYNPNDLEGLLAAGDNFMAWADSDPERFYDKYEDARFSYARVLEKYGWQVPVVERMLKYFIRTDNLKEVLHLRVWFENEPKKRPLSAPSLAELAGYLLDKQLEVVKGVPDPYLESIQSVREMLLKAIRMEPTLPEPHYHLARYHHALGNTHEERLTLENAIRAFDIAQTESVRRRLYRVDAHYRYANLLIEAKEFFPAEENVVKGIELYEEFLTRSLVRATPQLGQLYGVKGDLEFFVKSGDMEAALKDYHTAERYGYAPPEMQYRMGSAYYQLENWRNALDYLFKASTDLPLNRRMLYALGNAAFRRGDFFAAQGYYDRLISLLENQRMRLPSLMPSDGTEFLELGERLMMARNNAGVVYEALARQTGNREYRSRAMALYALSSDAWDAVTRNPQTMIRSRFSESSGAPSINLGYLNANNALRPVSNYNPQIFPRIDKDVTEPSRWEALAPFGGLHQ
jgi:tetratricopeptide (TPR) repeat protein